MKKQTLQLRAQAFGSCSNQQENASNGGALYADGTAFVFGEVLADVGDDGRLKEFGRSQPENARFLPMSRTLECKREVGRPIACTDDICNRAVSRTGLEPVTKGLKGPCSTIELAAQLQGAF